jgi:hypothetical protein
MPPLSHLNPCAIGTSLTLPNGLAATESNVILLHYWLSFAGAVMTHHHHRAGAHPSPALTPSLLRLSALQRLSVAGFLIALIWAAAFWATN